jgi:hypothetical protein
MRQGHEAFTAVSRDKSMIDNGIKLVIYRRRKQNYMSRTLETWHPVCQSSSFPCPVDRSPLAQKHGMADIIGHSTLKSVAAD